MEQYSNRNLRIFYMGKSSVIGLTVTSIYLKWQLAGLDYVDILFLQGLFGLFILIFEFPSGIIADITKRKYLVSIGFLSIALGTLVYGFATEFYGFLFAELLFAIGLASRSGSDTANIFDYLKKHGREEQGNSVIAKGRSIEILASAINIALGGILTSIDIMLPIYIAALISLIISIIWLFNHEVRVEVEKKSRVVFRKSLQLVKNKLYIEALLVLLIVSLCLRMIFWAYIPKFQEVNIPVFYFGIIIGTGGLISAISSWWLSKQKIMDVKILFPAIVIGLFGVLLFIPIGSISLILLGIIGHQIARGIFSVYSLITVNNIAEGDIRSSAISLNSTLSSFVYLIFTSLFNFTNLNLRQSMITITFLYIILILFIVINRGRMNENDKL